MEVDGSLDFAQIGYPLLRELDILKPFGVGNPEPLFMTSAVQVCERKIFSAGVRYRLRQAGRVISGVIFGVGDDYPGMPGESIDIAYRLGENEWNGTSTVELKIVDVRPAAVSSFASGVSG